MLALASASSSSSAAAACPSSRRIQPRRAAKRTAARAVVETEASFDDDGTRATGHHNGHRSSRSLQHVDECTAMSGKTMGQRAAAVFAALSLTASVDAAATTAPAVAASKGPPTYVAELVPTRGNEGVTGSFTFRTVLNKSNQEVVEITADVKGLSPGAHGINIHSEGGDLTCDDGGCTGASFNPGEVPHGGPESLKKFGASACHYVGEGCVLWRHIGGVVQVFLYKYRDDVCAHYMLKSEYRTDPPVESAYRFV